MNSINNAFNRAYTDISSHQAQSDRPSHFMRVLSAAIHSGLSMAGDYSDVPHEAGNVARLCLEMADAHPVPVAQLLMSDKLFKAKAIELICDAPTAQDRPTDVQALTRCLLQAGCKIDVNPDDLPEAVKTALQDWGKDA